MARPVYRDSQPTAKARLKEAFWKLLAETNYSHITVKRLTTLAQVNPNMFYYHYDSMDALALDALNEEKLYEIPSIIRSKILSEDQISLSEALEYIVLGDRWKRIRLFVTSDSAILHQLFYDSRISAHRWRGRSVPACTENADLSYQRKTCEAAHTLPDTRIFLLPY